MVNDIAVEGCVLDISKKVEAVVCKSIVVLIKADCCDETCSVVVEPVVVPALLCDDITCCGVNVETCCVDLNDCDGVL